MAYKCYRYIGETFNSAQTLQYNEVFIHVVKGIFDKVCTDFDDIVPVSEWIDLDEFVDPGGYTHTGCKKYFYIDSSDCRFALVYKEWTKPNSYDIDIYHQCNVTIQATNLTNDSEYAEGWEIVPTQFAFYYHPDFDPDYHNNYWYPQTDAWIITVITDDNNHVVGISAPQYWLESDYDGHSPCNMFMIDKENKLAIPGCNLKSSLSGSVFPYGSGKWLANYTPDYDIIGRVLYQYERLSIRMDEGKAVKALPIYNDMFNNTFALSKLTNHEMSVFMNYEWESKNGECYNEFAITVDGQLWQPIGTSLYIPVSYKEDILEYINLPTP